jgi:hypothetical protein
MEVQQMEAAFRVSNLINHYLQGNLSAQEQAELEAWIISSPQNKAVFETLVSPGHLNKFLLDFSQKNKRKNSAYKRLSRRLFPAQSKVRRLTERLWRYVA